MNLILINSEFPHACLGLDVSPGAFIVPGLEWYGIRDMEYSVMLASVEPSFILVLIFGPTDHCCTVLQSVCKIPEGALSPPPQACWTHRLWATSAVGSLGVYVNPFTIVMPSCVFRRHSTDPTMMGLKAWSL